MQPPKSKRGPWVKYLVCFCLIIAAAFSALAADPVDDAKAVQGTWAPAEAILGGKPMSVAILKTISLKMHSGKYEVLVAGNPDKGTYQIDSASKPTGMTIVGTEGPNRGRKFPAIYEIKGDTLRICYDLSGAKRPAEFKSIPGTRLYLVTYNRKKD
ncbi:MAG TPA: TIGR03067 domain-containing protein [Verrucomicrobiae bacterium]|nr:TIGR03067 domain-containing protein [Verrucomicrobiae bacterium]